MVQQPRGMAVTVSTREGKVRLGGSGVPPSAPPFPGDLRCLGAHPEQGVRCGASHGVFGVSAGRTLVPGLLLRLGLAGGAAGGGRQPPAAAGAGSPPRRAPRPRLPGHRRRGAPRHRHLREPSWPLGRGRFGGEDCFYGDGDPMGCPYSVPWARSGSRWARRRWRCWCWSELCAPRRASPWSGTAASSPAGMAGVRGTRFGAGGGDGGAAVGLAPSGVVPVPQALGSAAAGRVPGAGRAAG